MKATQEFVTANGAVVDFPNGWEQADESDRDMARKLYAQVGKKLTLTGDIGDFPKGTVGEIVCVNAPSDHWSYHVAFTVNGRQHLMLVGPAAIEAWAKPL